MNKIRKVSILLLLLIVTVCVIFLPQLISGKNEETLLNKKSSWNYDGRSSVKITSKQVARLYCNGTIGNNIYNSMSFDQGDYDEQKIKEKLMSLFEVVFQGEESVCKYMKTTLMGDLLHYSQNRTLTMIDDRPVVLNFINVGMEIFDGRLEVTYEGKTETLIQFSYYSAAHPIYYKLNDAYFIDSLELTVGNYFENQLKLEPMKEYYFFNEVVERPDFINYETGFCIIQYPEYKYEIEE